MASASFGGLGKEVAVELARHGPIWEKERPAFTILKLGSVGFVEIRVTKGKGATFATSLGSKLLPPPERWWLALVGWKGGRVVPST